jgi:hypothetical protein
VKRYVEQGQINPVYTFAGEHSGSSG